MKFVLSEIIKIIHLRKGDKIPDILDIGPCSIFICDPSKEIWGNENWRHEVCDWIIGSNCRYMVAWGPQSSKWDDGVDGAYLVKNNNTCHDKNMCMTTWHDKEILESAFEFFLNYANLESDTQSKVIVDISQHAVDFYSLQIPD